jgi:hypothetical protein
MKIIHLVNQFIPKNEKRNVVISPRFRKGFKRNWNGWKEFYDLLSSDKKLMNRFNFIICGKRVNIFQIQKNRFLRYKYIYQELEALL